MAAYHVSEDFFISESNFRLRYGASMPGVVPKQSRSARRRAETRARLLAAGRAVFAENGVGATRLGEITERADVATGSFYNHFADKEELVDAVMSEVVEEQGSIVDEATRDFDDPAAVVAFAHAHFVRLAREDPSFGQLLIRLDASHRVMSKALGPRALRDIQTGLDTGRFSFGPAVAAMLATGGALLGTMRGVVDGMLDPDADRVHAVGVLRMLGLGTEDAEKTVRSVSESATGSARPQPRAGRL
jgi:AcrR family transcriptional regulator